VYWAKIPGATTYRIELSNDNARTWKPAGQTDATSFTLQGLQNGHKYHARLIAANSDHSSEAGPEYPIYASADPPAFPDGLKVILSKDRVDTTWGEVLGVREYHLYRRAHGSTEYKLVYAGPDRKFTDHATGVVPGLARPGILANALHDKSGYTVYEYAVASLNGNGESPKSPIVDTNPASWTNWDPKPGEPFRRRYTYNTSNYLQLGVEEQHDKYYPK
jgi:hypothetical protein